MEGMQNANAKSNQKSIVRFCSFLRDLRKMLQNAQKIQRIPKIWMQVSRQATRMFQSRRMVMSNRTIDRKCTLRKRRKERQFLTEWTLGIIGQERCSMFRWIESIYPFSLSKVIFKKCRNPRLRKLLLFSLYFNVHALAFYPETYKFKLRIINIKIAPKEVPLNSFDLGDHN